jgi:glycine/D-amino acid oxidase-like deaminating enzyme
MPPPSSNYNQWSAPESLKKELEAVRQVIYGNSTADIPFNTYRFCWDAYTPDDNFFVTPHPHINGLFIATGGSFHGWKMMPVIGKYVLQMIEGTLSEEHRQRWAWDRPMPAVPTDGAPKRELRDEA